MKSSNDVAKIISAENVSVRGSVVFCLPDGEVKKNKEADSQEDELKSLEVYWNQKGIDEGRKLGFDEGYKEGQAFGREEGIKEGIEKGREEGLSLGRIEGEKVLREELNSNISKVIPTIENLANGLKKSYRMAFISGKEEVLELLFTVIDDLLHQELKNKEVVEALFLSLLKASRQISKDELVDVHLFSDDFSDLKDLLEKSSQSVGSFSSINFLEDADLQPGQIRIETPKGILRYEVQKAFKELKGKLYTACNQGEMSHDLEQLEAMADEVLSSIVLEKMKEFPEEQSQLDQDQELIDQVEKSIDDSLSDQEEMPASNNENLDSVSSDSL